MTTPLSSEQEKAVTALAQNLVEIFNGQETREHYEGNLRLAFARAEQVNFSMGVVYDDGRSGFVTVGFQAKRCIDCHRELVPVQMDAPKTPGTP